MTAEIPDRHPVMDLVTGQIRVPGVDAPRNEWVAYAVSRGLTVAEAESLITADLIAKYIQNDE